MLALFTAALANAIRAGAAGAMKAALLDPIDAQHSGEMIGTVLGSSFLGFALSLLVISPLLDKIGAKRVMLFAAACFIVGPALVLLAAGTGSIGLSCCSTSHGDLGLWLGRDRSVDQSGDRDDLSRRQDRQIERAPCLVACGHHHRRVA